MMYILNFSAVMTGSYNNFFRIFDRNLKKDYTLEGKTNLHELNEQFS